MQETIKYLKSIIKKNNTVVVACSGGPDSMCLLSLLCDLKKEIDFNIIVAHVNHKIRKESETEAVMVEKFARENGLIFEYKELKEFESGNWTEDLARKKRYSFFKEVMDKYNAQYLLTAHHGDDLIETVLMRITRGSTLSGYLGIKLKNNNIIRPLLYVNKKEIMEYVNRKNIPYALDKSNNNLDITRNRYRHTIIPFLENEDKNVHKKYLKFSKELEDYEEFVNKYIINNKFIVDNYIVINKLLEESKFIQRKTIELLIKDIQTKDILYIDDNNMQDILELLHNNNKKIDLNNNYQAINSYGKLMVIKKNNNSINKILLDKDLKLDYWDIFYNTKEDDNTNNCIRLNSKEIQMPLYLRNRYDGDIMIVKNLGRKKVKDIFINSKIPLYKRDSYPLLVDGDDNILLIPGVKKSKFAKDKSEKYDIIVKCEARRELYECKNK